MSPENFPANSHRAASRPQDPSAQEEPIVKPVVKGRVVRSKTPLGRRVLRMFFSGTGEGIVEGVIKDVFVPALQSMVTEMFSQGINRAIYGDSRSSGYRPPSRSGRGSIISYNDRYPTRPTPQAPTPARRPVDRRDSYDIGDIVLEDRLDAEAVLEGLQNQIQDYGSTTVATLFNLMEQSSVHTDHKWGWTDLSEVDLRRVASGWRLVLPYPEHLSN